MGDQRTFPEGFTWGVATASYQIEGAATEGGRVPSIWDVFSHTPGKVVNGDTGDVACDHYHRFRDDVALMASLGVPAYRLSIAWPRILKGGDGEINEEGIGFYSALVDELLAHRIEPWITLYHWDLPQVLDERGGWADRDMILPVWDRYVEATTSRLGDRVKHWITINEPFVVAHLGYNWGIHAPGRHSLKEALAVNHSLLLAHGHAVRIVRKNVPGGQVGITLNMSHQYPLTENEDDLAAAWRADGFSNRWFADPVMKGRYPADMLEMFGDDAPLMQDGDLELISAPTDFLGLNSYSPTYVRHDPSAYGNAGFWKKAVQYTAMDWPVDPKGFQDLLERLQRDYDLTALYVTENGSAWNDVLVDGGVDDSSRVDYLISHLNAVGAAIEHGVAVKGYFAWSFMDNYEWAEGYNKRFGLVHVDYETQQRTPKRSAKVYADVIRNNAVERREVC